MDTFTHNGNLVTSKTSLVKQFRAIVGCFAKALLNYKTINGYILKEIPPQYSVRFKFDCVVIASNAHLYRVNYSN